MPTTHTVKINYIYHIRRQGDANDFSKGYIGISYNPKRRLREHRSGQNPHLTAAFSKYNDIEMVIISQGTREEMLEMEVWLRPNKKMGWNCEKGGGNPPIFTGEDHYLFGKSHSEESKRKISEANEGKPNKYKGRTDRWDEETRRRIGAHSKGRPKSQAHRDAHIRRVRLIDKDLTFECMKDAAEYCGKKDASPITKVCRGKQITAYGYKWEYV